MSVKKYSQTAFVINNQPIPWWLYRFVKKMCLNDKDRAMDVFWKSRRAVNVVNYIRAGMLPDNNGNRYALLPSVEYEQGETGRQRIRSWWVSLFPKQPSAANMTPLRGDLADVLIDLANSLKNI